MKITRKETYTCPTWALSAIINGDYSGIEDPEDKAQVEKFIEDNQADFYGEEAGSYHSSHPVFGLPCECVDLYCLWFE